MPIYRAYRVFNLFIQPRELFPILHLGSRQGLYLFPILRHLFTRGPLRIYRHKPPPLSLFRSSAPVPVQQVANVATLLRHNGRL